jgi:ABC-2 type transport system ATP-binding protein
MEITINHLSKHYRKIVALQDISLTIPSGMFGLLGRNGAGKTSLMRILATLSTQTSGDVTINNIPIKNTKKIREIVGYLPQDFSMYPNMTVYGVMDYLGLLSEIPDKERKQRITDLLKKVNLQDNLNTKVKALSGGMKRRLGIAQALLHNPQVLIVDEPTAGLDPEERIRFRNLLCEFAEDRIVILSTHIVEDIGSTCQKVAVLNKGKLVFCNSTENLIRQADGKVYSIEVPKMLGEKIKEKYTILSIQASLSAMQCRILSDTPPEEVYHLEKATLEDGYMQLLKTQEGVQ